MFRMGNGDFYLSMLIFGGLKKENIKKQAKGKRDEDGWRGMTDLLQKGLSFPEKKVAPRFCL